ncbi:MAG TPA: outer membrane beta-barrel protein [Saprospiraceae bacterium]|nr:outer membrane beta-barrel protein [Saprospiraceae bacterium]
MSDSNYQDWKDKGWQQMQETLDQELPKQRPFPLGWQQMGRAAVVLMMAFMFFQNYSLNKQLIDNQGEMAMLESRLSLSEMNAQVGNDLLILENQFDKGTGTEKFALASNTKSNNSFHSIKAYDISQTSLKSNKIAPLQGRKGGTIDYKPGITQPKFYAEASFNKIVKRDYPNELSIDALDYNAPIDLTKKEYRSSSEKRSKGIYAFVNTRSDVQMYGAMLGMFTSFDINAKLNVQTGLGYVWSKNDYAIQATQIDEVVLTNQLTGVRSIQRIEYPTRIIVDNLHYLQIPVSINYKVTPRLTLGTGIEGRFLINNYYSANAGKDYNLRVTPYTDQSSGKLGQPHDYDLRKYALGAIGRMEYRLNERYGLVARHYMGLVNISGDKVYNARNEIRNSSFNAGIKVYF